MWFFIFFFGNDAWTTDEKPRLQKKWVVRTTNSSKWTMSLPNLSEHVRKLKSSTSLRICTFCTFRSSHIMPLMNLQKSSIVCKIIIIHMRRLVWGFAVRTLNITNFMLWLCWYNCACPRLISHMRNLGGTFTVRPTEIHGRAREVPCTKYLQIKWKRRSSQLKEKLKNVSKRSKWFYFFSACSHPFIPPKLLYLICRL